MATRKAAPITLDAEAKAKASSALRQYLADNFDERVGDLKASLLLDFIVEEIGPSLYNQALGDARAFIEERAADIDAALHRVEFPVTSRMKR